MMKKLTAIVFVSISLLFVWGCSDLQETLPTPQQVNTHASGVLDKSSPNFHGALIDTAKNFDDCRQCHGAQLTGGITGVSCVTCHATLAVHVTGILNPSSGNFHGKFLANNSWNLTDCKSCHGSAYAGGMKSPGCSNCHTQTTGPEACNTCHGDFSNPELIAPPQATNGDTTTTSAKVGAHSAHLFNTSIAEALECTDCHTMPSTYGAAGHIDASEGAEVIFSGIADIRKDTLLNSIYNRSDNTCANTYCHGNFAFYRDSTASSNRFAYTGTKMTGTRKAVVWNKVNQGEASCGSCHGLPPAGHMVSSLTSCVNCHAGVVDNTGKIISKAKHINGTVNVFGN